MNIYSRMKIKSKITLIFSVVITLSLLISSFAAYRTTVNILKETHIENEKDLVKHIGNEYSHILNRYASMINYLSEDSDVSLRVRESYDEAKLLDEFKGFMNSDSNILSVYLATTEGDFFLYPQIDVSDEFDASIRPWYVQALKEKDVIITNPIEDAITGELIVTVAKPILDGNKTIAVLGLDLSVKDLEKNIENTIVGESGTLTLVDSEGKVVVDSKQVIGDEFRWPELLLDVQSGNRDIKLYTEESKGQTDKYYVVGTMVDNVGWYVLANINEGDLLMQSTEVLLVVSKIGLIILLLAIVIAVFFGVSLSKPINKLMTQLSYVSRGNFTTFEGINTGDEIGGMSSSMNTMIAQIGSLIRNLKGLGEQLGSSAESLTVTSYKTSDSANQINKTIEEIAIGAQRQAESTLLSAEIANNLQENILTCQRHTDLMLADSVRIATVKNRGVDALKQLEGKNDSVSEANVNIDVSITKLSASISEVSRLLESVMSIASQTNLLALNASIEAARAGESGKGFAVIANEIRLLSTESSRFADDIKQMIDAIESDSNQTEKALKTVKLIADEQNKALEYVSSSFEEIDQAVCGVENNIREMAGSIDILSENKEIMMKEISSIAAVSQQTAAATEEAVAVIQQQGDDVMSVSDSAAELFKYSEKLIKDINIFKV